MKIYSSVADEFNRKFKDNEEQALYFFESLVSLYKPNDKNNDKENLLTIFLNNCNNKNSYSKKIINKFFAKKFKLQVDKINCFGWDFLINSLDNDNNLKSLPDFLLEKDDWFYLKIPTIHIKKLMNCFYDKNKLLFSTNDTILNYIFNKKINFENYKQTCYYLNDLENIISTLFVNKNLSQEQLSLLLDDKIINQVYSLFERPLYDFVSINNIKHLLCDLPESKNNSNIFDSKDYLNKLRGSIFAKVLNHELSNDKTINTKIKKI